MKTSLTKEQIIEIRKCYKDIFYFAKKYCKILTLDEGIQPFNPFEKQVEMMDTFNNNRFVVTMASRQFGKTVAVAIYLLWKAMFNENYEIAILADQERHAIDIIKRIRDVLFELPEWLQPVEKNGKLKEDNKKSLVLSNNAHIFGSATTVKSVRGTSINILYLDEFALVPPNLADDFIANAFPTISSGKTTQILITSTPKGFNHFWEVWTKSEKKLNNFIPIRVDWWDRPDRDDKWKEERIKEIGEIRFAQEYGNEFLGSQMTLIDAKYISLLELQEPIDIKLGDSLLIYEEPQPNVQYVMGVDTAKVANKDYNTIQILRVDASPLKQVAVYRSNKISFRIFDQSINYVGKMYNDALCLIERNDSGQQVADALWFNQSYENLVWDPFVRHSEPGILTTKKTKQIYLQLVKDYIENQIVEIIDGETIRQISTFVLKTKELYGPDLDSQHDDSIMALGMALFYVLTPYYMEINYDVDAEFKNRATWQLRKEIEDLPPIGFLNNQKPTRQIEKVDQIKGIMKGEIMDKERMKFLIHTNFRRRS